ncbi:MAG: hypothetical protein ACK5QX_09100 [bacterium]
MLNLLNDLEIVSGGDRADFDKWSIALNRLRAFIEAHQPWYPPQPEGFGPWIEYSGKNGPRVDEIVCVLDSFERERRKYNHEEGIALGWDWEETVAYCVKLESNDD